MRIWWAGLFALTACGRVSFAPLSDAAQGRAVDAVEFTADFDAPFGSVTPLTAFNDPNGDEDDISLTGDMLDAYFMSTRGGTAQLYRSTRIDVSSPWSAPTIVTEIDPGGVNNPRVRDDGLELAFTSARPPSQLEDIWISTRADRAANWGQPRRITELATLMDDYEPFLTSSGLEIYFLSQVGAESDVFVATRPALTEPFGPSSLVTSLSGPLYDGGTWFDVSQRFVWFHSNRDGETNIYRARRDSTADPFGTPVVCTDVDVVGFEESDPWLSPDGHTIYFMSKRTGDEELYMATR